jgi:CRP-like cAMP-binding protein
MKADGSKRVRSNRVKPQKAAEEEEEIMDDLNEGGMLIMGEDGNMTATLLPFALRGHDSFLEAPLQAKSKVVKDKERKKIVINPNMIKPAATLRRAISDAGTSSVGSPATRMRGLNDGDQDFMKAAQKSTGWGSRDEKSKKKRVVLIKKAESEVEASTVKETVLEEVVPAYLRVGKGRRGHRDKDEDDQQERLAQMGVFPEWLWERDDFQELNNQSLADTCLHILASAEERRELHINKLRAWFKRKEGGARIDFLSQLPSPVMKGVCKVLKLMRLSAGQLLHREGQTEEIFYMLYAGTLIATTKAEPDEKRVIQPGQVVGHSNLPSPHDNTNKVKRARQLEEDNRQQVCDETIRASSDCILFSLGFYAYDSMQLDHVKWQIEQMVGFLKGLPTFSNWENSRIRHLYSSMQSKVLPRGDFVWRQGMAANSVMILLEGHVSAFRTIEVTEAKRVPGQFKQWETEEQRGAWQCKVRQSKKGDILGLEAFTGTATRDFSIRVRSESCRILILKQRHFLNFYAKEAAKLRSDVDTQRQSAAVAVSKLLSERYPSSHDRHPILPVLWALQGEELRETHYSANAEVDLSERNVFHGLAPGMVYIKFNPELQQGEPEYDSSPEPSRSASPAYSRDVSPRGVGAANAQILLSSAPYKMPTAASYQLAQSMEEEEKVVEEEEGGDEGEDEVDDVDSDESGEVDEERKLEPEDDFVPVAMLLRADNTGRSVTVFHNKEKEQQRNSVSNSVLGVWKTFKF